MLWSFTLDGPARPQQRHRSSWQLRKGAAPDRPLVSNGQIRQFLQQNIFVTQYYPKESTEDRKALQQYILVAAKKAKIPTPIEGPVGLHIVLHRAQPKKPATDYPRGDVDNFTKVILDALQGETKNNPFILRDDSQVTSLTVTKQWAAPDMGNWTQILLVTPPELDQFNRYHLRMPKDLNTITLHTQPQLSLDV